VIKLVVQPLLISAESQDDTFTTPVFVKMLNQMSAVSWLPVLSEVSQIVYVYLFLVEHTAKFFAFDNPKKNCVNLKYIFGVLSSGLLYLVIDYAL